MLLKTVLCNSHNHNTHSQQTYLRKKKQQDSQSELFCIKVDYRERIIATVHHATLVRLRTHQEKKWRCEHSYFLPFMYINLFFYLNVSHISICNSIEEHTTVSE